MKTATLHIDAISLTCPYCQSYCANPDDGSFMWTSLQVETLKLGKLTCFDCGRDFKVPVGALKVG